MPFKNWREKSRGVQWGTDSEGTTLPIADINAGSLLRIADAAEKMAENHAQLIEERDKYYRWYKEGRDRAIHARNVAAGLRSAITRLQRKVARLKDL